MIADRNLCSFPSRLLLPLEAGGAGLWSLRGWPMAPFIGRRSAFLLG